MRNITRGVYAIGFASIVIALYIIFLDFDLIGTLLFLIPFGFISTVVGIIVEISAAVKRENYACSNIALGVFIVALILVLGLFTYIGLGISVT